MIHQCPKCELRFTWQTELEDHCRDDHPAFQHAYPASVEHDYSMRGVHVAGEQHVHVAGADTSSEILATYWNER